ncbi:MAG: hypothetical protein ACI82F_000453 [Planctomycetota bacterium]|jgi:hypothetical protein
MSLLSPALVPLLLLTFLSPAPVEPQGSTQGSTQVSLQDSTQGFAERFALAEDREALVGELIPGTEEHYFYSCLLLQAQGDFTGVDDQLSKWEQRLGNSERLDQMRNRQALLNFEGNTEASATHLGRLLGLGFDHQQQVPGAELGLPTRLDEGLLSHEALIERALGEKRNSLAGFRDSALGGLATRDLNRNQLANLLDRLPRPSIGNLAALVIKDLEINNKNDLGSRNIHDRMTLSQLEECVRLRPSLLSGERCVELFLRRLQPGDDSSWRRDSVEREVYLTRLERFVNRLTPAFNSLKAHVLHHRLKHDLEAGEVNRGRLVAYLRLPRSEPYMDRQYFAEAPQGSHVNLNAEFQTELDIVSNDGDLVRACLTKLFVGDSNTSDFDEILRERYLRRTFAEAKLMAGVGDRARWFEMLDSPSLYEEVEQRVELEFSPEQQRYWAPEEGVTLEVDVKNVPRLLVKVFEIDAFNYYRTFGDDVNTGITLDGLVSQVEHSMEFDSPAIQRVRRRIELPSMSKPGVFVVELVGGGVSSRAVIRKGELRFTERRTSAGHAFRVLNEKGQAEANARLWFGGKEYTPADNGEIYLPYSTSPGLETMILRLGERASMGSFRHLGENYRLGADFFINRETVLGGEVAEVMVRPRLSVNDEPLLLSLLEKPVLTIQSVTLDGVEASLEVTDLELSNTGELISEIRIPANLRRLSFSLRGSVRQLSQGTDVDLNSGQQTFVVNGIDATVATDAPFLSRSSDGYVLDVLGKDGEPRAGRAVTLQFELEHFIHDLSVTLQTDSVGRIHLGSLVGVTEVQTTGFKGTVGPWRLADDARSYPSNIAGVAGETLRLPLGVGAGGLTREHVSLFEMRSGVIFRDVFSRLSLEAGTLEMKGLEPGNYRLDLPRARASIAVRVTTGERHNGWAIGQSRWLALEGRSSLQLAELRVDGDDLLIRLDNVGSDGRVHVASSRYLPAFDIFRALRGRRPSPRAPLAVGGLESDYESGRALSDEVRYVLDRRFATRFPGNLLRRPGMLLNPWSIEETDTDGAQAGEEGESFGGPSTQDQIGIGGGAGASGASISGAPGTYQNLDFLPQSAVVLSNLRPDANGLIRVPLASLGEGQHISVLALDRDDAVQRSVYREELPLKPRSGVLADALVAGTSVSERRRIEFLGTGQTVSFEELPGSRVKLVDSLAAVFQFFQAMGSGQDLSEFGFLLEWPTLEREAKLEFYSEFACHELDLFLHQKDETFFNEVVRPTLANKIEREFMDDWLLGEDVSEYVDPWLFNRLNVVERILLARRLSAPGILGSVVDLARLIPDDPRSRRFQFDSLMGAGGLDAQEQGNLSFERELSRKEGQYRGPADTVPPGGEPILRDSESNAPGAPGPATGGGGGGGGNVRSGTDGFFLGRGASDMRDQLEQLGYGGGADDAMRASTSAFYRGVDQTQRMVETYYRQLRIQNQVYGLIPADAFWRDFAEHGAGDFVSSHLADAAGTTTEMLLALALLDLPFVAPEHEVKSEGGRTTLTAAGPLLVVRRELSSVERATAAAPILVSQNYYRLDEPKRAVDGRLVDAFVTEEFVAGVAYGCKVVLTNPTSSTRSLEVLLQIPRGARPVQAGFRTRGVGLQLPAYGTQTIDYAFYFPRPGTAAHYPAQVSSDERIIAQAELRSLPVVPKATVVDLTSWGHVSQSGTLEEVLMFLASANPHQIDLSRIAWRMSDQSAFDAVIAHLRGRHVFDQTLWSYGLKHRDREALGEYLRFSNGLANSVGPVLVSDLLRVDPIQRRTYQRMEFDPLVLARSHEFAGGRDLQNSAVEQHYKKLIDVLAYTSDIGPEDRMELTYSFLLQNRIEEALASFGMIDRERSAGKLQYDYMRCYMAFFGDTPEDVRALAMSYSAHPLERWRTRFADVVSQLDEVRGAAAVVTDPDDQGQGQVALASTEPSLSLDVEDGRIRLEHANLETCELRFYPMDVELLFSSHPFGESALDAFGFVRPAETQSVDLSGELEGSVELDLPSAFATANVVVEVRGAGVVRRQASYANTLSLRMMENYGQLQVRDGASGDPLSRVYVKVFVRLSDGSERFHKDGYTDLRGRFDYASLSGPGGSGHARFAILVMDDDRGAIVREAAPPQQ